MVTLHQPAIFFALPTILLYYTPHYTVVYSGFSPPYYTVVYTLYSILYSCSPQGSKTQGYTSSGWLYIDSRRPKKDVHTHRCSFVQGQTTFGQWLTYSMPSWLSWVSDVLLISSETMRPLRKCFHRWETAKPRNVREFWQMVAENIYNLFPPKTTSPANFDRCESEAVMVTSPCPGAWTPSHTIPYHTIPYHAMPYHTMPYHTM